MARLLAVCHSRLVMVDLSLPLYQRMGCTTKDRAARLSHAAQALPLSESALRSLSSVAVPSAQTQWSLPDLSYFRQFVVLTSGSTSTDWNQAGSVVTETDLIEEIDYSEFLGPAQRIPLLPLSGVHILHGFE